MPIRFKLFIIIFLELSINSNAADNSRIQQLVLEVSDSNELFIPWAIHKIDSTQKVNNIPALSVAIIKNGAVVLSDGFGVYTLGNDRKVTENSIYQIGSDTKKMTSIIAKKMEVEGKLDMNLPISHYIKEELSIESIEKLNAITLNLLLQHQSGLPYREPTMKRKDGEPMLVPYTEKDVLNGLNSVELENKPGSKMNYSNFGYAVAGYLCEKASGQSYNELLYNYIVKPYQLINTTVELTDEQKNRLVTPYLKSDRMTATKPFVMGELTAAGGVYSNVKDMTKLMLAQIEAYRNYDDRAIESPLVLTHMLKTEESGYGYGLSKKRFKGGTQYGHGGDLDGFASAYIFSPEYNCGIVILASSGGQWIGELEKEIFYELTDRIYVKPKKSFTEEAYRIIAYQGIEIGKKWMLQYRNSEDYYLKEIEINQLGYAFLDQNYPQEAIAIFKFQIRIFPNSVDGYKALADAYSKSGNKRLARKYNRKSIHQNLIFKK